MMKRQFETVEKKVYGKPMIQVVKVDSTDIICTSTTIEDPWAGNEEEEW